MRYKVVGPPGTGKTRRLLNEVQRYVNKGVPLKRIGYFAFTRKAAGEARDRFLKIKTELTKKDIKISVKGDQLTISGERKNIIDNSNDHYHYRERSVGKFKRSFNLPESINRDKIHASFKNGILSIELEKHEEIVPKEMEISIS